MAVINSILLVEQDPSRRAVLGESLRQNGCHVVVADGCHSALRYLRLHNFDSVVLSLDLPGEDSWICLKEVRADRNPLRVVAVCGRGDPKRVVRAIKEGVVDVLEHPCSAGAVMKVLKEAVPQERPVNIEPDEVLGSSSAARLLREQVKRLAGAAPYPILIQGEEGTGRGFLATAVHRHSTRRGVPIRTVDCAALPKGLLECELFGRGTGPSSLAEGHAGGVLLIKNLEELPLLLQGRLLGLLRTPSGASNTQLWVMATASLSLTQAVIEGRFRKDLFFALSGLNVVLPPLRERDEDVVLLARAFVDGLAASLGRSSLRLASECESRLLSHSWPRNIQELKSVCEYAVVASEGDRIEAHHLYIQTVDPVVPTEPVAEGVRLSSEDWSIRSMERALIDRVLERAQNNITQAAKELGINRSTLYNKMREYQLGRGAADLREGA